MNSGPLINNTKEELMLKPKSKSDNTNNQKKNKLNKTSLILNSENFKDINDTSPKVVKIGINSYILSRLSSNGQIKYIKTFFENGDILKSYYDKQYNTHYGIYNYYKIGTIYEGYWKEDKKSGIGTEKRYDGALYEGEFKNGKKWYRNILLER